VQLLGPMLVASTNGSLWRWPDCTTQDKVVMLFEVPEGEVELFWGNTPKYIIGPNAGMRTSPKLVNW
jgi:hypothetical protein